MSEISDKHREHIKQLREKVSGVLKDEYLLTDASLYKWLEFKDFKVEKAERAILKNIQWRKDNNIDNILHESFGDFYDNLLYHTDGVDKHGRPVLTTHVAQVDIKEALDIYCKDKDKGDRHNLKLAEENFQLVKRASENSNGKVESMIAIMDYKGIKLKPFMSKIIELVPRAGKLAKQIEKNYPGIMEKTYLINAPKKVSTIFTMLKPFLKGSTVKKIKIIGKKDEKWREVILNEVDADQLRQRYGGTRPDELPAKV